MSDLVTVCIIKMCNFFVFVCLLCSVSSLPFNSGKAFESNDEFLGSEGHEIHNYDHFQGPYHKHCEFENHQLNFHHHGEHHQPWDHHPILHGGNKNSPYDQKPHVASVSSPAENDKPSTVTPGTVDTTKEPTKLPKFDVRFDANK